MAEPSDHSNEQVDELRAKVRKIASSLDVLSYFDILRLRRTADDGDVRAAYQKQARAFHPDRFPYLEIQDLMADLRAICKRIAEAYVVLRNPQSRTDSWSSRFAPKMC